jgi:hypothetical protein
MQNIVTARRDIHASLITQDHIVVPDSAGKKRASANRHIVGASRKMKERLISKSVIEGGTGTGGIGEGLKTDCRT